MAQKDYSGLAATAVELIQKYGRQIVLVKYDQTPASGSEPWRGAADPRATAATASIYGVFVPLVSREELGEIDSGELFKDSEVLLIAEPGVDYPETLDTFNEIVDGTTRYAIKVAQRLKPGNTTLIYFFGGCR